MPRYTEVEEAIKYIQDHLYEPLPLAHLAKYVGYSPYHFSRIFKEQIGLSPLYYVSSMRLQKAKELLINTHLSVRDIGLEIGQQSLGTFTTRFTHKVGMSPSQFRESKLSVHSHIHTLQSLSDWNSPHPLHNTSTINYHDSTVKGTIQSEKPLEGFILIGLFAKPIPEGMPLYGTLLSSLGDFHFLDVQRGVYYLLATSITWGMNSKEVLLPYTTLRAKWEKPIIVGPGKIVPEIPLTLRPPKIDDPPILISLPILMNSFLTRIQSQKTINRKNY